MSIIKDIALKSGVSSATVGHILGNKQHMHSVETRKKVMQYAHQLGYRPNSSAKAIGSGRFQCATLLMSTVWHISNLPDNLFAAIHDVLDESDYHLNVARMSDERMTHETSRPKFLREWMTDGILVNYTTGFPSNLIESIKAERAPAIWINSKHESDCVYPDDYAAGYDSTVHLIQLGHRNIAFAVGYMSHYSTIDRYKGYENAMKEAALVPRLIFREGSAKIWSEVSREVCESLDCPTAFVAYAPETALSLSYAVQRSGRRVPEDVSIVTFAGAPLQDRATGQEYTTWLVPEFEVGRKAARMLLQRIENPNDSIPWCSVPFTHTEDYSCAALR